MFTSLKKRLSKSFNRATELLSFVGPTPAKQFRNAIIDGDEEKALTLYLTIGEGEKCLKDELPPSAPFPSKKNLVAETPLYLAAKHALHKLLLKLLELGGDPSIINLRNETCLHAVCSLPDHPETRANILELLVNWEGVNLLGEALEKISINKVDMDGNTAIHYAASSGLLLCVLKLISYGAIISIVNKGNQTCCELADEKNYKDLASMLELALVYQPEDASMEGINAFGNEPFLAHDNQGKLFLDTKSMNQSNLSNFIEETVMAVSRYIGWMNASSYKPRAEALLTLYSWNAEKLVEDYMNNSEKVLTFAKMSPVILSKGAEETPDRRSFNSDFADLEQVNFALDSKGTSQPQVSQPNKLAALLETVANDEEEVGPCGICGDVMYCSQDVNSFIKGRVTKPDNRALSCLSGHNFCISCWSSHLTIQVNDNGLGYLPCPAYKCGERLDITWAPVLLKTQELVNKLKNQRIRHVIDCSGLKYCSVENCGLILYIPNVTTQVTSNALTSTPGTPQTNNANSQDHHLPKACTCANGHCFCLNCMQPAHSPCTCTDLLSWQKLVAEETNTVTVKGGSADEIANALWVAANTKRCPRCGTAIEKDEGCNHMSCRKCRKEFCWICMQDWSLHSDNTGGYFQCNRFVENQGQENANEVLDSDIWAEERGNAHAEALRSREKNRRMARFIHHFTRYQAHGQSYQMELKMSKDTLKRITDSLKLSREGKLVWLQGSNFPIPNPVLPRTTHTDEVDSSLLKEDASTEKADKEENVKSEKLVNHKESLHENIKNYFLSVDPSLEFLTNGFEELIKCRQFIQWSYPYAYFEFADSDDSDYNTSNRRNAWMRSRSNDHRVTFEFLQADLESTVETLSDVVARRRLRAAQSQIAQATQAAKQKRIEFETFLTSYAAAKASSMSTPNTQAMNRLDALTSRNTARSRARHNTNRAGNNSAARLTQRLHDLDNARELSALLMELELASSLGEHGAEESDDDLVLRTPSGDRYVGGSSSARRRSHRPRRRQRGHASHNANSPNANSARYSTSDTPSEGQSNVRVSGENNDEPNNNGEEDLVGDYEDENVDEDTINLLRLATTANGEQALSNFNEFQLTRLAQRAEEEAELNRAILMSLQYANATTPAATNDVASSDAQSTSAQPTNTSNSDSTASSNIDILMSMGFTRAQSVQALRETRDNVELAANRLLGLDF